MEHVHRSLESFTPRDNSRKWPTTNNDALNMCMRMVTGTLSPAELDWFDEIKTNQTKNNPEINSLGSTSIVRYYITSSSLNIRVCLYLLDDKRTMVKS